MRKLKYLSLMLAATLIMSGCGQGGTTSATTDNAVTSTVASSSDTASAVTVASTVAIDIDDFDDEDYDTSWDEKSTSTIKFDGTSATVTGNNLTSSGSTVTINGSGTFVVTGSCSDGNIIVEDTAKQGLVHIILNGTSITSSTTAPVFVKSADKVVVTLADGTENTLEDASEYVYASTDVTEPSAALFSKDDLTINGNGTLTVNANLGDAIQSKDDLKIASGVINITSNDDGLIGKDSVQIEGGTITINAQGDGIKSTNDTETEKGNVVLYDGTLNITAEFDGIQSENQLLVYGGTYNITTGGGSANSSKTSSGENNKDWGQWGNRGDKQSMFNNHQNDTNVQPQKDTEATTSQSNNTTATLQTDTATNISDITTDSYTNIASDTSNITLTKLSTTTTTTTAADSIEATTETTSDSAKALKAANAILIQDGTFNIDSSDDSIHSNGNVTISGGTIAMASGDDGVHADETLTVLGGSINITKSYEGLEGLVINFQGGDCKLVSSDDGLNAAGGNDNSSVDGRSGMNGFGEGSGELNISGGTLWLDAAGDGLDSNGTASMSGGTVFVNGPTNSNNGALDYDSSFDMTGGTLVAVGATGMAQSPSTSSSQPSIAMTFSSSQAANSVVYLQDSDGNNIVTFAPNKTYQSVIISSPALKSGSSYTLYTKDSSDLGDNELHLDMSYTSGTKVVSFELADSVTYVNESGVTTSNEGDMMNGGGKGGFGMGDRGQKGNFTPETNADGSTKEMQTPPDMKNGDMPSGMDGQTPPDMGNGDMPSGMDGQTPPDMGNGGTQSTDTLNKM